MTVLKLSGLTRPSAVVRGLGKEMAGRHRRSIAKEMYYRSLLRHAGRQATIYPTLPLIQLLNKLRNDMTSEQSNPSQKKTKTTKTTKTTTYYWIALILNQPLINSAVLLFLVS